MNKIYNLDVHLIMSTFVLIIIILLFWETIPDTICLHINYDGLCDNTLSREFIFLLPALTLLLLLMLKYISLNLDQINIDKDLKPENAARIINIFSVLIVLLFSALTFLFLIKNNIVNIKNPIIYFYLLYLLIPLILMKSKLIGVA